MNFIKRYWDILCGAGAGLSLAFLSDFKTERVQLLYSIVILILVSIGVFRILKERVDKCKAKRLNERQQNIIDGIVDSQKSIKAISLAQCPTKEGEKLGKFIIKIWGGIKRNMNKIKTFFDKFKGYMLSIALVILTVIESYGGYINTLLEGKLTVNGVDLIPIITFLAATIVGMISNGFTKEQCKQIKTLFSKTTTNGIVKETIKNKIKENTAQLAQLNKALATKEHEQSNLENELDMLNNTFAAKKEMCGMTPQLATPEDVQIASNAVAECQAKIAAKKEDIKETTEKIDNLTTIISALKSQL